MDQTLIRQALTLLGELLRDATVERPVHLIVCGGAALIDRGLVSRTTRDVDVVALLDRNGQLASPDPLPVPVLDAAKRVAAVLDMPENWLNNGPSRGEGGLFQGGLPAGVVGRLTAQQFGSALTVHFVGRLDQICFKVYAATDQGPGRHFDDLQHLRPTEAELALAVDWVMTQDPSEDFKVLLQGMLRAMDHETLANRVR